MPPFPHVPFPRGSGFRDVDTDVVVVGAGVVGAAAAWQLARRGHEVLLLDRFDAGHAHGASHGSARLFRPTEVAAPVVGPAIESAALWRELEAQTGAELLQLSGGVDHGDPARTAAVAETLTAHGIAHRWLTPPTRPRTGGRGCGSPDRCCYQPDRSGRIHADLAVSALTAAAVGHGAAVRRPTRVESITVCGPGPGAGAHVQRGRPDPAGGGGRRGVDRRPGCRPGRAAAAADHPGAARAVPAARGQPLRGPRHRLADRRAPSRIRVRRPRLRGGRSVRGGHGRLLPGPARSATRTGARSCRNRTAAPVAGVRGRLPAGPGPRTAGPDQLHLHRHARRPARAHGRRTGGGRGGLRRVRVLGGARGRRGGGRAWPPARRAGRQRSAAP